MTRPAPSLMASNYCDRVTDQGEVNETPGLAEYHHDYVLSKSRHWWLPKFCDDKLAKRKAKAATCKVVLIHELCHILHGGQHGQEFAWSTRDENADSPDGGWIPQSGKVSRYAMTNRTEFVAEVCAGLILGVDYDSEVLQAYRNLGGPAPNTAFNELRPR